VNATEVITALRVHYGDGWKLVEQVADHTGFRASRWLDVMAFGLWPSRGLEIHGIEVKVTRADFRREIDNPRKADATAARCDRFWIAAPAGIVDPLHLETLAPSWGLLEVVEDRAGKRTIRTTKKAEQTDAAAVDRDFLAAVLRRIPGVTDEARAEIRAEVERENEIEIARHVAAGLAQETNGYAQLKESVAAFEATSGIALRDLRTTASADKFGHAVRLLADELGGWESARQRLRMVGREAQRRGEEVTAAAERVRELVAALDDVLGIRS
jgi:hypothetical protein